MDERRKSPRIDKTLPLKLCHSEYDILTETKNISSSGVYFHCTRPLDLMTKLNVVLLIPLKKAKTKVIKRINCCGIVVRRDQGPGENTKFPYRVAMYFSDLKEPDKKILASYVNTVLKSYS
jgi:hypothetical protein